MITRVAGAGFVTLDACLAKAIGTVVGYVKAKNPVGVAGTIPDELLDATKALTAYYFVSQVASDKLVTKPRQDNRDAAIALLRDVARGQFKIDPPDTYAPKQAAPTVETVQDGNTGNSRDDLAGL